MLFMLVIASAVGIVWGSVLLKKTGLLGGCLTVMLVGSCFGYAYYHTDVGGFSVTADRVLLALLAIAFVAMGRLGLTERRQLDKMDITLLLFMGVLVISTHLEQVPAPDS